MFGRGRIKDGVRGEAKVLELGPTAKGARQTRSATSSTGSCSRSTARRVEHVEEMPALKAPLLGDVLPVTVGGDRAADRVGRGPGHRGPGAGFGRRRAGGDAAGAAAALGFTLRDDK